jgi:hypothetical protein
MKTQALREFAERLGPEWQDLADHFEISSSELIKFKRGREPVEVINWLKRRGRTGELAAAIKAIGRADLTETVIEIFDNTSQPNSAVTRETEVNPVAFVSLDLTLWAELVEKKYKLADDVVHKRGFQRQEELFKSLNNFLDSISETLVSVELRKAGTDFTEIINNADEFWIRVIATLVVDIQNRLGPYKWLIKETMRDRWNRSHGSNTRISEVWSYILDRYCDRASPQYRSDVLPNIVNAAIDRTTEIGSSTQKSDLLFVVISLLFQKLEHDTKTIKQIVQLLKNHHDLLGNSGDPHFLEKLKTLIGIGSKITIRKLKDLPAFTPELAHVKSKRFSYEIEAMIHPLTVLEISFLEGIPPQTAGENVEHPYLFKAVSDEGKEIYNLFSAEIESIVNLANRYEPDPDRFEWDIPTVVEWIALASCEDQPYPWGTEKVSPKLANFDFGEPSRLRPVGSCPLGSSKFGIQDCFGNVHEIVRISERTNVPRDFRLAGGCYQTNAHLATPGFIRKFKSKQPEVRRNIGLRLVRYNQRYREKRFRALEEYQASLGTKN